VVVPYTRTFDTAGGSVAVKVAGDEVSFVNAFPQSGWMAELEQSGPEKVEVHFKPNDSEDEREIKFRAWVQDGVLVHEISEEH